MSYQEYEGMNIDRAIDKLRAKSFHDEEDKAFARARRDMFSPEELAAITGDDVVEVETPATEGDTAPVSPETEPVEPTVEGGPVLLNKDDFKLDELQAKAAELNLDTSGTKQEIVDRINAFNSSAPEGTE